MRNVDLVSYLPRFMAEFKEINAALEAENPEFILIWSAADRVLSNQFIESADECGISRFEKLLGILPSSNDTLEVRRARVMSRWANDLPYTVKMLIQNLISLCGGDDFILKKNFGEYQIYLTTHFREYSRVEELRRFLNEMIPANMVIVVFNITNIKADGKAVVFTGVGLSGKHRKIRTEVKNYGLE